MASPSPDLLLPPGDAVVSFISQGNGQYTEQTFQLRTGFDAANGTWIVTSYARGH